MGGGDVDLRKQIVDYCLTLPGTYEDYPFDDFNWTVMRHGYNKKAFALIFERMGHIWVNVKGGVSQKHVPERRTGVPYEQNALEQHYSGRQRAGGGSPGDDC